MRVLYQELSMMVALTASQLARAFSPRLMALHAPLFRSEAMGCLSRLPCSSRHLHWAATVGPTHARVPTRLFASELPGDSPGATTSSKYNRRSTEVQARLADRQAKNLNRAAKAASTTTTAAATDASAADAPASEREWNLGGLRKEVDRQVMRQLKKVGKAENRLAKSKERAEAGAEDSMATSGEWGPADEAQVEVTGLVERLEKLRALDEKLAALGKTGKVIGPLATEASELGLSDEPPPPNVRGPGKAGKKGPSPKDVSPRKPYRIYSSADGIEVYVGKSAADNDVLSIDPNRNIRDQNDWWMHVAGSPGSHVVIRCPDAFESLPRETVTDAAVLAAKYSKGGASKVKVAICRCRDISKPSGTKPGLVYISSSAEVRTVRIDLRTEETRINRLESQQA